MQIQINSFLTADLKRGAIFELEQQRKLFGIERGSQERLRRFEGVVVWKLDRWGSTAFAVSKSLFRLASGS